MDEPVRVRPVETIENIHTWLRGSNGRGRSPRANEAGLYESLACKLSDADAADASVSTQFYA